MTPHKYLYMGEKHFGVHTPMVFTIINNPNCPLKSSGELQDEFGVIQPRETLTNEQLNSMFKVFLIRYLLDNKDMVKLYLL